MAVPEKKKKRGSFSSTTPAEVATLRKRTSKLELALQAPNELKIPNLTLKFELKINAPWASQSQAKSRISPQIHRAGRQAGAINSVRRAGWVWAASLLQQQRAAQAECTCAGAYKQFPSRSLLRRFPTSSLTQRSESQRIEMQCMVPV